jgi:hypothetical protein
MKSCGFKSRSFNSGFTVIWALVFLFKMDSAYGAAISLADVLASVAEHYPILVGARMDYQKAQADYLAAQGAFDPSLKSTLTSAVEGYYQNVYGDLNIEQPTTLWGARLIAGWRNGQGAFPVYDSKYATYTGGEFRGGVEIPILKGGLTDERRVRLGTSEKGLEFAERGVASQKLDVNKMAAFNYWEWVAAGKKLKVAEDLLGISLVRDKALIDRVRHGDTPQIDQTDNQRAVVQRRSAVLAAERLLQKASFELSLYLRDDSGNPRVVLRENLPADFPEPVVDEVEKTVVEDRHWISQHPEVERLRIQIEQAQLEYRLAANQLLPKLDFNFGVYKDFGVNPGTSPYLTAYSNLNEIRLGLSLEFPLFFRTPRGKLESASLVVNKLGVIRGLAQDRIQVILNDSRQAMKTALERLAFARKEISLNQKLEEAERVRFKHGDSNVLMINIREQITCDAWFKEYDALVDFYKAKAEFSAAQGSSS